MSKKTKITIHHYIKPTFFAVGPGVGRPQTSHGVGISDFTRNKHLQEHHIDIFLNEKVEKIATRKEFQQKIDFFFHIQKNDFLQTFVCNIKFWLVLLVLLVYSTYVSAK
jgi:hypothetical protein